MPFFLAFLAVCAPAGVEPVAAWGADPIELPAAIGPLPADPLDLRSWDVTPPPPALAGELHVLDELANAGYSPPSDPGPAGAIAVPEPATIVFISLGGAMLLAGAAYRHRRR